MLIIACAENNDLYQVLTRNGSSVLRFDSLEEALANTPAGSGILSLADSYPRPASKLQPSTLEKARKKGTRLYVEYPSGIPGMPIGEPRQAEFERLVVTTDFFSQPALSRGSSSTPSLHKESILAMHACWFLPVQAHPAHLVLAKVAGYRRLAYGMPDETFPILFDLPGYECLVSSSKLSQFVTGRYAPFQDWIILWQRLLRWLENTTEYQRLQWQPLVHVQASQVENLPKDSESKAFQRSINWFKNHTLFKNEGRVGVIEGYGSAIDYQGRQAASTVIRADCTPETAMVLAWNWSIHHNPQDRQLAGQILDTTWFSADLHHGTPKEPEHNLLMFNSLRPIFFPDDNARAILASLVSRRLLDDSRWDEAILRCLLANFRLTGKSGFSSPWIEPQDFPPSGWKYFYNQDFIVPWPHFQAYPLAAYLWAYTMTGQSVLYQKANRALRKMMDIYPHWRWTNGFTQELARMLLPLSFLVRIEDSKEHRSWLARIAVDLLSRMQPCGAIREEIGQVYEDGEMRPPRSNESYGTGEASLLHENGDPVCDLLYTMNYAVLGLHEAAAATRDSYYSTAENKLVEFLCRIQVRSESHPYLDGSWMRAFDYDLWEHWGSSSDTGWGAWCVETGWTNTWIASVLAMRQVKDSIFSLENSEHLKSIFPAIYEEMMPGT